MLYFRFPMYRRFNGYQGMYRRNYYNPYKCPVQHPCSNPVTHPCPPPPVCPPPCPPLCNPCQGECTNPVYNEADYCVDVINQLFCDYCEVEKKADACFQEALCKLHDVIGSITKGLDCNKEGYVIWVKIEQWLRRYYERFGVYCGCIEKMTEIRDCVGKMLEMEWKALELSKGAAHELQQSRDLDVALQCLKKEFCEHCLPKC